jgi:hypothetical protein
VGESPIWHTATKNKKEYIYMFSKQIRIKGKKIMDETDKMEDELNVLIEKCRNAKKKADKINDEFAVLKEDLRTFMIDSGIKEHAGVQIVRGFSFDLGLFKMDHPKIYKLFVEEHVETVTKTKTKFSAKNKEKLRNEHTEIYRDIVVENTPQVRGL